MSMIRRRKMRPYEVMVIFEGEQDEADVKKSVEEYTDLVAASGATIGSVDHWGKRKFAYPINKKNEGYYVVFQTMAEPEIMAELGRQLQLATNVVRHIVLRIPEEVYAS